VQSKSSMDTDLVLTVITPTMGRPSLDALIMAIDRQTITSAIFHILLWDDKRDPWAHAPGYYESTRRRSLIMLPGSGRNGAAPGSALRAVGLMAVQTPWVTFADEDVRWDPDHAEAILAAASGRQWATSLRRVWSPQLAYLGVDRFEAIGDAPGRLVDYEMSDNNLMVFRRELGTAAAVLYRETRDYNDDRLMYAFLKQRAGQPGRTGRPTIDHICPDRLVGFFSQHCSPS